MLSKEDRALGIGMRGIHTGKEVEEIEEKEVEEKGVEEKGAEEKGAEEIGAEEKHNKVIDDPSSPTIRRALSTKSQKVHTEAAMLAREEIARQTADPDAPGNKQQPAPAALLAAITGTSTLPYAIGTDLCYIPRVQRILGEQLLKTKSETRAPKFWFRVLTPVETSFGGWKYMRTVQRRTEFLAGRWAAKEAVMKAWESAYPHRVKLFMHDIFILSSEQCKSIALAGSTAGAPAVVEEVPIVVGKVPVVEERVVADVNTKDQESSKKTSGPPRAFVRVANGKPWKEVNVSISHDGDFASAVALVTIDTLAARRVLSKDPDVKTGKPMIRSIKFVADEE